MFGCDKKTNSTNFMEQSPFEKLIAAQLVKKFSPFVELRGSFLSLQQPVTSLYLEWSNQVYVFRSCSSNLFRVITRYTTYFNIKVLCNFSTECIHVFHMILTLHCDEFPKWHQ
jgi:hypothetical protein